MHPRPTRSRPTAGLPEFGAGVTLLDVDDDLGVTPVQALLIDQVLGNEGDAYWVDAVGAARTTRLRELVPDQRVLERIHVARGFTPYQHTSLIDRVNSTLDDAAVVVATGVDRLYRDGNLSQEEAETMQVRALTSLARIARVHDLPVIVTRSREDDFSAPLANAAATHLRCRKTPFGPRFEDDAGETETLVYHTGDGWMQTTLAYWREVLEHRVRMHDDATLERTVGVVGVQ
ncbi:hypothetical protein JCM17823_06830 [Halorubrum gandharaense]